MARSRTPLTRLASHRLRWTALALAASLLATLSATLPASAGTPPTPAPDAAAVQDDDDRINETVLFSRDVDRPRSVSLAAGQSTGSALADVAVGTDITYARPPGVATTWTRRDHGSLSAGGTDTTLAPQDASLESGRFVVDAHASVFSVTPATRAHEAPGETPLYVAPRGKVHGLVDYRIEVPPDSRNGTMVTRWTLLDHRVSEVQLQANDLPVGGTDETQVPVVPYVLPESGEVTLELTAKIRADVHRTVIVRRPPANATGRLRPIDADRPWVRSPDSGTGSGSGAGNDSRVIRRDRTIRETLVVKDQLTVRVYRPEATVYTARYPDGDVAVAAYQAAPWQGFRLADAAGDGDTGSTGDAGEPLRVRGVWRFYTARDPDWIRLTKITDRDVETVRSSAMPVYVHAYPSLVGPRAEPTDQVRLQEAWGRERPSPAGTIDEDVTVGVIERDYRPSFGLAARSARLDRDALRVRGIVHGVNASVEWRPERRIREAALSVTVLEADAGRARLLLELRDAETGAPIQLGAPPIPRYDPVADGGRDGYITVAGQRVRTNASGMATVTVTEPGVYTARYRPESWLAYDPAYAPTSATAKWHPLTTPAGWLELGIAMLRAAIPFLLVWYAGRKVGRALGAEVQR